MAFVDLAKNRLVLKAVVAGPPAVGKTTRLAEAAPLSTFGSTVRGRTTMTTVRLDTRSSLRPVELELYEWHGPERADVRGKALFTGLDGVIYVADAREDRWIDTKNQFDFLVKEAGRTRLARLPGLLVVSRIDEGLLRAPRLEKDLAGGPTWSERAELGPGGSDRWLDTLKLFGELVLARVV